ncbi:hypothetical protein H920_12829 [Fukomys damarensis]|uniref:Uncharacterized protein n=1 Tax=Fukomys damarensis TaxID=885580 RepID=A0A091D5G1_FUKDA|nr:hypothetical protein H920_12829 [Fukomys damarensis]
MSRSELPADGRREALHNPEQGRIKVKWYESKNQAGKSRVPRKMVSFTGDSPRLCVWARFWKPYKDERSTPSEDAELWWGLHVVLADSAGVWTQKSCRDFKVSGFSHSDRKSRRGCHSVPTVSILAVLLT